MTNLIEHLPSFLRDIYRTTGPVPLHEPRFVGNERSYLLNTLDSTFVSSVGPYVDRFEQALQAYTGATRAVATVNGTAALHIALRLAGVKPGDLVVTQPLTFIATCNAITYCGAHPAFVDVDRHTLSLSPSALATWLDEEAERTDDNSCRHKTTGKTIRAVLPMHTFGHPADLNGLLAVCDNWNLPLVEDAAESLGSLYYGRHTGTFGLLSALSFNGNKIITTGGGGMVLTQNESLGAQAKHLTTTARLPYGFEFVHDEIGYNYRLPNLNAALGCAQMEKLEEFVAAKRRLAEQYAGFFSGGDFCFVQEREGTRSNYWLNAVLCPDRTARDELLTKTNQSGIMTRPVWQLMSRSAPYGTSLADSLPNAEWLEDRLVNLPSSVPLSGMAM